MLLLDLLVLLPVVDQLFHEEHVVVFLAGILDFQLSRSFFQILVHLVKFLRALSHAL